MMDDDDWRIHIKFIEILSPTYTILYKFVMVIKDSMQMTAIHHQGNVQFITKTNEYHRIRCQFPLIQEIQEEKKVHSTQAVDRHTSVRFDDRQINNFLAAKRTKKEPRNLHKYE